MAIPTEGPDLDAEISPRLGLASHVIVLDPESMAFEAVPVPTGSGVATGMQVVALIIAGSLFVGLLVDAVMKDST